MKAKYFTLQTLNDNSLSPQSNSGSKKMAESGLALFLSVLFLLLFVTARVYCCGMSTHIDIAHQAINWFKDARNGTDYREIILKHQDAFIAGNPYPDSMYSSFCYSGKFHSIAEDTHWSPFLNATVNYIRKKYPKPWDQVSVTNKDMQVIEDNFDFDDDDDEGNDDDHVDKSNGILLC